MSFNPDSAVELDESAELDDFMSGLDRKIKGMRLQVLNDAFKELVTVARRENAKLLDDAVTKFGEKLDSCFLESGSIGKIGGELESLSGSVTKLTSSVEAIGSGDKNESSKLDSVPEMLQSISSDHGDMSKDLRKLRDKIDLLPAQPTVTASAGLSETDATMLRTILLAIQSLGVASNKPKPSWVFRIERDDYARISNIVATPRD